MVAFWDAVGRAGCVFLRLWFTLSIARCAGLVPTRLRLVLDPGRVLPVVPRIRSWPFIVGRKVVPAREVELIPPRFVVLDCPWAHTENDMPISASTRGRIRRQVVSEAYMGLKLLLVSMDHSPGEDSRGNGDLNLVNCNNPFGIRGKGDIIRSLVREAQSPAKVSCKSP